MRIYASLILLLSSTVGISAPESHSLFSIEDAVTRTLTVSPQLKQAEAEKNAQREKKRGAWSDIGPRVSGTYNEVRFQDALTTEFSGQKVTVRPERTKIADLKVVQPITGLAILIENARIQGSLEDVAAAKTDLVRSDMAFRAADAWLKAFQSQQQLEIAKSSILSSENQLKDAYALERAGRINHGDVLKLELLYSESKARESQARAFEDIAFANLKETTGIPSQETLRLTKELPKAKALDSEIDQILKIALDKRPEVQQAKSGVELAMLVKKAAYAQFSPNLNVFVQFERNLANASFGTEKNTRTYGIQLTWNLWNNGSTVFSIREAGQKVVQAEEGYRNTEMNIRLDVLSTLANLKSTRESLEFAKIAVKQAEEAYRIEKVKFKAGNSSASDLVIAETASTASRNRLVSVESDYVSWHLKLQKALGEERPLFIK